MAWQGMRASSSKQQQQQQQATFDKEASARN
jgi:hypothetical protein